MHNMEVNKEAVRELVEQALTLAADYGDEVEAAVRAAAEEPLDSARAERLYRRLLGILRGVDSADLSGNDRAALVAEIDEEVAHIVNSVERPAATAATSSVTPQTKIEFVEKNGLQPHPVRPVPFYNGASVPMEEGYVDVEDLTLWPENARLELHVAEFRERNRRDPDRGELVALMQGEINLPSLNKEDPFELLPLARSIARRGVERPPIITWDGVPRDGNRRIAASLLVLDRPEFNNEEKERAKWIKVWRAPEGTTEDQFDAIVVALNFEPEHKLDWPEYVKARLVCRHYEMLYERLPGLATPSAVTKLKKETAAHFGIIVSRVTRYLRMVQWADDFEQYHVEHGQDAAAVRYRTDDIFQWFYELDAGKGEEKLTKQIEVDEELKGVVYDLMLDTLDSGVQVRGLYKVVGDPDLVKKVYDAGAIREESKSEALTLIKDALDEARRKANTRRKLGFEEDLKNFVERFGARAPDDWETVDTELLLSAKRVFAASLTAVEGELEVRRVHGDTASE